MLGSGSYGTVVKAKCLRTKRYVAIKLVQVMREHQYSVVKVLREVQIMEFFQTMKDKYKMPSFFTGLLDIFCPEDQLKSKQIDCVFMVMKASVQHLGQLIVSTDLEMKHFKVILYNMLCSMKFLHSANIMHRDLKPANILVDNNCQVMVCDFGLARTLPESC